VIVLWCELGAFSGHLADCRWPESQLERNSWSLGAPWTHILFVADPQLLGPRSYPGRPQWINLLTQFIVDFNLRKSWRVASKLHPDVVVFMGDLMDDGRVDVPLSEYEQYVNRFNRTFTLHGTPAFYLPGNHDVGLGRNPGWFSPDARQRFEQTSGPTNQVIHINDRLLVFIDAPRLVDEEQSRRAAGQSYQHVIHNEQHSKSVINFVQQVADTYANDDRPRVLLSHIPLSRSPQAHCGPLREKGTISRGGGIGYQNLLDEDTTQFLLESLKPTVIFSGDDHDYCEVTHSYQLNDSDDVKVAREVSIKSFSMAMGIRRPGFQVMSVPFPAAPDSIGFVDRPCELPDQVGLYLHVYIPAILCCVALLALSRAFSDSDAGTKGRSWEEMHLMEGLDQESDEDKPALPASILNKQSVKRPAHVRFVRKTLLGLLPTRWRTHLLRSSGSQARSKPVIFLVDIWDVAWPVLTFYFVVSVYILW